MTGQTTGWTDQARERFDVLVEDAIAMLPKPLRSVLDSVPVFVDDEPDAAALQSLGMHPQEAGELCGMHEGSMLNEAVLNSFGPLAGSVSQASQEDLPVPPRVCLYRSGIVATAGGWDVWGEDAEEEQAVYEQVWITLLHELGHVFGLGESDLDALGYG